MDSCCATTVPTPDHTVNPDIETASDAYARRFSGEIGRFFLDTQRSIVAKLLARYGTRRLSILEIGGGHGQLTEMLLQPGHHVVVHSSDLSCFNRLSPLRRDQPNLEFVVGNLELLPFAPRSFDLVLAFRLLPHTKNHKTFLEAAANLSREEVIFDYAPLFSGNLLATLLFPVKRYIEKNTREFFTHRFGELRALLSGAGFAEVQEFRQFSFPMGLHRLLAKQSLTERVEDGARRLGITKLAGSPSIISARRYSGNGSNNE